MIHVGGCLARWLGNDWLSLAFFIHPPAARSKGILGPSGVVTRDLAGRGRDHECSPTRDLLILPCVCVLSHVQLCDPMDCSLPGSCVHGILQARILEWVTISSSRGSSRPRDLLCLLRLLQILYHSATWEAWRVPFSLPNWMRPDWSPSPPIPRYSPFFPDPQTSRGAGLAPFFCLPMYPSRTGVLALPLTSCGDQPGRWRPVIPLPGTHTLLQCLSRGTRRSHVTRGLSEVMLYCFGH